MTAASLKEWPTPESLTTGWRTLFSKPEDTRGVENDRQADRPLAGPRAKQAQGDTGQEQPGNGLRDRVSLEHPPGFARAEHPGHGGQPDASGAVAGGVERGRQLRFAQGGSSVTRA